MVRAEAGEVDDVAAVEISVRNAVVRASRVVAGHEDGASGGDSRHRGDGAEAESEDGRSAHIEGL